MNNSVGDKTKAGEIDVFRGAVGATSLLPPHHRGLVLVAILLILFVFGGWALLRPEQGWIIVLSALGIVLVVVLFLGMAISRRPDVRESLVVPAPKSEYLNGESVEYEYDVFVAATMSAHEDAVRVVLNEKIIAVCDKIRDLCSFRVFYAGYRNKARCMDDEPGVALRNNIKRIRASHHFVLIYTDYCPTSALLETGMALALGKPSIWFLKNGVKLPFLLRTTNAAGRDGLPNIKYVPFDDSEEIENYIQNNRQELFS